MQYVDLNGGRVSAPHVYAVQLGSLKMIELINGRVMLVGDNPSTYDIVPESEIVNALNELLAKRISARDNVEQ